MTEYILAADVGGTNIQAVIAESGTLKQVMTLNYKSQDMASAVDFINTALKEASAQTYNVTSACLALAGPVLRGEECRIVTLPSWPTVRKEDIVSQTSLDNVLLVNDFEVLPYGVGILDLNETQRLNDIEVQHGQPIAIIGAGTGLGLSVGHFENGVYKGYASEGGHMDFPPRTQQEFDLARMIEREKGDVVTYKMLLSGNGLELMYKFYSDGGMKTAEEVAQKKDDASMKAMDLFSTVYGRFARVVACDRLPYGGLFVFGGIAQKNPELLTSDNFKREFLDTKEQQEVVSNVPIFFIIDPDFGMKSALFAASQLGGQQ